MGERGRSVKCSKCGTKLGVTRTVKDLGMFRMVKTEWKVAHFHYHIGVGEVTVRCWPCATPGYSPEFEARMLGYAERERAAIAERRAGKIARGLSVGDYDPGQHYLDDLASIRATYLASKDALDD